jgi:predicted permease
MAADLRHAGRMLVGARFFTVVVITCLALAIATNATMFSVFDAMFLRPLPFTDANRLVSITGRETESGRRATLSLDDVRQLQSSLPALTAVAGYTGRTVTLTDEGEPERITAQLTTANLFSTLGVQPQRGRGFEGLDDRVAAAGVALISDRLWRRRYQGDVSVIGRAIRLDNAPFTIVGVMPPLFRFPSNSDLWIPMTPALGASGAATRGVAVVGRLAPDRSIEQINSELAARVLPASASRRSRVGLARTYRSAVIGAEERLIIVALMSATTVLLLMTCVNVANLLLARGAGRRREIAVRAALGATRLRLVQQQLLESILLALAAAAIALPLSWYAIGWVHDAVPATEPLGPYYVDWSLDRRTFVYSLAIALVAALAVGLAPALDATRRTLVDPMRDAAGSAISRGQRRVHNVLVVLQMALTVLLLAGASLFVRTYAGLSVIALGYDPSHLMTMRVYLGGAAYDDPEARARAVDAIAGRLNTLTGAHAATVTDLVPLDDQGGSDAAATIEDHPVDNGRGPTVHYAGVAGRWAETFDLRMVAGRTFYEHELQGRPPVVLVNARLAALFWPGQDPIGRRFRLEDDPATPWLSVIGVVPDIRTVKLDEGGATPPTAYLPHRFLDTRNYGIVIRTSTRPEAVTPEARAAVHALDPALPLFDVYAMDYVRWFSYWMYVMWGTMFAVLGAIAIGVGAIGVYGVVFYTVAQRTREIGLRIALGATRGQVVGPMLLQIGLLSGVGLMMGLAGAVAMTPVVGSLLIGISPNEPMAYAALAGALAAIALVATWLPARRATAADPLIALRDE